MAKLSRVGLGSELRSQRHFEALSVCQGVMRVQSMHNPYYGFFHCTFHGIEIPPCLGGSQSTLLVSRVASPSHETLRNHPSYKPAFSLQIFHLPSNPSVYALYFSHTLSPFPYSSIESTLFPYLILLSPLWHSTMSVRPLPGASYHTLDAFPYTDIEAVGHFDTLPPGYDVSPFDDEKHHRGSCSRQHLHQTQGRRQRRCCGLPVLLSGIVLCCLALVVSAIWKYPSNSLLPLPNVPARHAPLADRLTSTFQTQSQRALVDKRYEDALNMMCVCH